MSRVDQIQALCQVVSTTEHSDPESVPSHNEAVDKLRDLIALTAKESAEDRRVLFELLQDPNCSSWVAWRLLEADVSLSSSERAECLEVLQRIAAGEGPDALAARWWLRDRS